MISANQLQVSGGHFVQHNEVAVGNKAPIDILTEAVAPNAFHDSGASFDKPKCHPRTRVKILDFIMWWIEAKARKQFLWLNGAAGCGKSAIAQSTVELCMERGLQLASFFFNRSDPSRNHAGSLIATLAYQLYCAFPETEVQTEVLSAIKKDPLIFKKTVQQQFTSLIIRPLMAHFAKDQSDSQNHVPFSIIIDDLDECIDRTAQKAILIDLARSLSNSNLNIPIFVASRPEHDIKLSFGSKFLKGIHASLSLDLGDKSDDDSDIRLYLFDRFAEIKDDFDNRTIGKKLAPDWPGDEVIETLVKKSSHQFIYAATVVRYVESTRHRPDHRLDIVMDIRENKGDHPFAQLDSLYAMILESASDIEKVLHVLSLYLTDLLQRNICCSVLENLLSYGEGELETLFCDLGALVHVYPDSEGLYLKILHASFREYLVDPARSKQFYIDMDCKIISHFTHVLKYLALCYSSSFNPWSIEAAPIYILWQIHGQLGQRMERVTISRELQQAAFSFPLKEFLEPHSTSFDVYQQLLEYFIAPYLELLTAMVLIDPSLSYIQEHQLRILRSLIKEQIQGCSDANSERLAGILCLLTMTCPTVFHMRPPPPRS
ncbi:hypothetical protein CPC08DRAFT_704823 [Agrocybe pediades]|nr:hypothetical protein CPC08DRAFT_704823 [Agrocybe pediades]